MPKKHIRTKAAIPPNTLLDTWMQADESLVCAPYRAHRERLSQAERLVELLWSFTFRVDHLPTNRRQAEKLEREYGDGKLEARKENQREAFKLCRAEIYAPLYRMQTKAARTGWGWEDKINEQEAECERLWQALQIAIVEIGERARDERRREELRIGALEHARGFAEETEDIRKWARKGLLRIVPKIKNRTIGRVDDPADQLKRALIMVQGFADASEAFLPQSPYRLASAGRREATWAKTARHALKALGLRADACNLLLIAWCLKTYRE